MPDPACRLFLCGGEPSESWNQLIGTEQKDTLVRIGRGSENRIVVPRRLCTFDSFSESMCLRGKSLPFISLLLGLAFLPATLVAQNVGVGYRMGGLDLALFDELTETDEVIEGLATGERQRQALAEETQRWPDTLDSDVPDGSPTINTSRVAAVGGLSLGIGFGVMEIHRRVWWEDRNVQFRFHDNWSYSRWTDKFGHYFSSSFLTRYYATSLTWAGLQTPKAKAWGAGMAWASMLYYEILDGFGPTWGFSSGDLFFNTLGVGLTYAQWQIPGLTAYTLKVSYWPSGEDEIVTADYAGITWWVTANLHTALPTNVGRKIPAWMNLAAGYAAREPDEFGFLTSSVAYLGIDVDLAAMPIDHPVWNAAARWLRYIHVPMPAIRLTPNPTIVLFAH